MTLDLTDWKSKKYQTRDGRSVRILCIYSPTKQPIVGIITHEDGSHSVETWRLDGCYLYSEKEAGTDLINAKTKREGWLNINDLGRCGGIYATPEIANDCATPYRVACIHIEWEE
jgi:hypothetical protein